MATDLSAGSERVVDVAIAFGQAFDASIELIHIQDGLRVLLQLGRLGPDATGRAGGRRLQADRIDAALAAQCARTRAAGLACITTTLQGRTAHQIISHVRKGNADLLVAGVRAEAQLAHVVRGRTGFGLAKGFGKPVVLVPVRRERRRTARLR